MKIHFLHLDGTIHDPTISLQLREKNPSVPLEGLLKIKISIRRAWCVCEVLYLDMEEMQGLSVAWLRMNEISALCIASA